MQCGIDHFEEQRGLAAVVAGKRAAVVGDIVRMVAAHIVERGMQGQDEPGPDEHLVVLVGKATHMVELTLTGVSARDDTAEIGNGLLPSALSGCWGVALTPHAR